MIGFLVALALIAGAVFAFPFWREGRRKEMDAVARHRAPGSLIDLSQGTTHYQWHGPVRGPVAVCIHGLTTPSFVWQGLAKGLSELGFRVLTYDLYGRGYSDRPEGTQDSDFFITQLEELLSALDLTENTTLIGYSMGGSIATSYTAKHPENIRHLVLIASAGLVPLQNRFIAICKAWPKLGSWLFLTVFPNQHRRNTNAERKLPSSVPNIADLQQQELDYRGFLPAVFSSLTGIISQTFEPEHRAIHAAGVPVLAIWAREDELIPLAAMGKLAECSRAAWQEVVEGAGHGLPYTHSEAVLDILKDQMRHGLN